jgi:Ala-tRNA(Pro) deacylase
MINKIKEFLDQKSIKYQLITHSIAYTAQEIAESSHIPGIELAKVVMITLDGKIAMAVVPASHMVDMKRIKEMTSSHTVELADEIEYKNIFVDIELGAMPPFGNMFNLKVFVATALAEEPYIVFNAGTHRELIKISYKDYADLVKPEVFSFSVKEQSRKVERPREG